MVTGRVLMLAALTLASGLQVAALFSVARAQEDPRTTDARQEERLGALGARVKGIEDANLRVRVAVIESAIEEIRRERDTDRKVNMGVLGGVLTLLMNAGYQIRLQMKRIPPNVRAKRRATEDDE